MRIIYFLLITGFCLSAGNIFAQDTLPGFTVKNNKGKISVSWLNKYTAVVKGISIQRSYDSSKSFSSITAVVNPNDAVNGFMDLNAPYDKMYYRLFIAFDSGAYIFTASQRPDPDPDFDFTNVMIKLREENALKTATERNAGKIQPAVKSENQGKPLPKKEEIPYPSQRIYTGKDNNIVISIPDFKPDRYVIKFFDEENKPLFVLNKITESDFVIEKFNFFHTGWFFFELYEDEKLLEKNKFYIPKD
jgi:hypothetical protein